MYPADSCSGCHRWHPPRTNTYTKYVSARDPCGSPMHAVADIPIKAHRHSRPSPISRHETFGSVCPAPPVDESFALVRSLQGFPAAVYASVFVKIIMLRNVSRRFRPSRVDVLPCLQSAHTLPPLFAKYIEPSFSESHSLAIPARGDAASADSTF